MGNSLWREVSMDNYRTEGLVGIPVKEFGGTKTLDSREDYSVDPTSRHFDLRNGFLGE